MCVGCCCTGIEQTGMSLRFLTFTIWLLLAASQSGCQLVDFSLSENQRPLSPDVLRALESQLRRDSWQRNPRVSPLETTVSGRPLHGQLNANRWRFGDPLFDRFVTQIDQQNQSTDENQPEKNGLPKSPTSSVPWQGLAANSPKELLDEIQAEQSRAGPQSNQATSVEGTQYLAKLAKRDDIVGWNAAILWAQRDPLSARNVQAMLRELVIHPPEFDPQTGNRKAVSALKKFFPDARQTSENLSSKSESSLPEGSLEKLTEQINRESDLRKKKNKPKGESKSLIDLLTEKLIQSQQTKVARRISPSMQSAAAEAWCRVLTIDGKNPKTELAPVGRYLRALDVPNAVRAELFQATARWIKPSEIPRLANALHYDDTTKNPVPVLLRRAAMEACLIHALQQRRYRDPSPENPQVFVVVPLKYDRTTFPKNIMEAELDPDSHVRETFGRWLAAAGHPQAFSLIDRQFMDVDINVRFRSLKSLGMEGSLEARDRLRERAAQGDEKIRAEAVKGLARWGIPELERYAQDKSDQTRLALAISLAEFPSARAGLLLWSFFEAASPRVQLASLQAVEHWPDVLAIPLLLHAMGYGSSKAAHQAFQQLKDRTLIEESFPLRKLQPERALAARDLARRYRLPEELHGYLRYERQSRGTMVSEQFIRDLKTQLEILSNPQSKSSHTLVVEHLKRIRPEHVPVLERLVIESRQSYPEVLFHEILADKSESYAALKEMYHDDPLRQRQGSQKLARLGMRQTLSPLVIQRMLDRIRERKDRVLWRNAMTAVMNDANSEAEEVAVEAAFHRVPAIRVLACQYFTRNHNPRKADILLQLMNDSRDRTVRLEAIKAAGYCQNQIVISGRKPKINGRNRKPRSLRDAPEQRLLGLQDLLLSSDQSIIRESAISLARLGDEQGERELVRMTYLPSPQSRTLAYQLMGQIGHWRYLDVLIQQGWGEQNPEARRAILKSLKQIVPETERPVGLLQANGYDAQIKLWATVQNRAARNGRSNRPITGMQDRPTRHTASVSRR